MAKYWIDPEKSTLALDANKLSSAVAKLWEEAETTLNDNTPIEAINLYLATENLALDADYHINALNDAEWLTESNLATLHELSGTYIQGTVLYCESDDNFDLTLTANTDNELEEDVF